ncbi:MAG: hypothetical protein ACPGN3_09240 [Opitutales bacterium]
MLPVILSWLGSVVAAIAGVFLLKGTRESQLARYLAATGTILPLIGAIAAGPNSKVFSILLPVGLIVTAAGGLLYSNIEAEDKNAKRIYAAAIVAIAGFSIVGWALVLAKKHGLI